MLCTHLASGIWRIVPALALLSLLGPAPRSSSAQGVPDSTVMLTVDAPRGGGEEGPIVFIGGWAVDPTSRGTGVDGVEAYLDGPPSAGGIWIGSARYGVARPDVAASFGRPEWANSGFALDWAPERLTPGDHTLYVYADSPAGTSAVKTVAFQVSPAFATRRTCTPHTPCPLFRLSSGWELDTGGPGTYFDRFPDRRGF